MNSSNLQEASTPDPFARLRQTSTLRGAALERWRSSLLVVAGCGVLGSKLAPEAVRSGASVCAVDPDFGSVENQGTQNIRPGVAKVESVLQACDSIAPGRSRGLVADIRHVGMGILKQAALLIDCTDDANLALPYTLISNGLGIPLLRLALDGGGDAEVGRVLASHGGAGFSCQVCTYSLEDLRPFGRTPCPGRPAPGAPPTLAGGAIGMATAGLGLLQSQRLVGGNALGLVLDRELILDFDSFAVHPIALERSESCLSQHIRWELTPVNRSASEATLADLFDLARRSLPAASDLRLEPFLHPLCLSAYCSCGSVKPCAGTIWAVPPGCPRCGSPMSWRQDIQLNQIREDQARELGVNEVPLVTLGLPPSGAMVNVISGDRTPLRFLLDGAEESVRVVASRMDAPGTPS